MKLYTNRILLDQRGRRILDMVEGDPSKLVPLTLGMIAVEALVKDLPQDNNAPGNIKIMRWKLAQNIEKYITRPDAMTRADAMAYQFSSPDWFARLSVEEANLVKTRIIQGFPTSIVGPADAAFEDQGDAEVAALTGGKRLVSKEDFDRQERKRKGLESGLDAIPENRAIPNN